MTALRTSAVSGRCEIHAFMQSRCVHPQISLSCHLLGTPEFLRFSSQHFQSGIFKPDAKNSLICWNNCLGGWPHPRGEVPAAQRHHKCTAFSAGTKKHKLCMASLQGQPCLRCPTALGQEGLKVWGGLAQGKLCWTCCVGGGTEFLWWGWSFHPSPSLLLQVPCSSPACLSNPTAASTRVNVFRHMVGCEFNIF